MLTDHHKRVAAQTEAANRIREALAIGERTSHELQAVTRVRPMTFNLVIQRLEDEGLIASDFEAGPYPRRRIWRLAA